MSLNLPKDNDLNACADNDQGTRCIYSVIRPERPALEVFLRRFMPGYKRKIHTIEQVYVYRLETRRSYEIGRIIEPADRDTKIFDLDWLSDGKHIHFQYKDAVYTMPVE